MFSNRDENRHCPKCGLKMCLLLTDYACDNCNPPFRYDQKPVQKEVAAEKKEPYFIPLYVWDEVFVSIVAYSSRGMKPVQPHAQPGFWTDKLVLVKTGATQTSIYFDYNVKHDCFESIARMVLSKKTLEWFAAHVSGNTYFHP